jgi:hypothetical protein
MDQDFSPPGYFGPVQQEAIDAGRCPMHTRRTSICGQPSNPASWWGDCDDHQHFTIASTGGPQ